MISYRVKEKSGEFTIQILMSEEKGFLWWKRKELKWFDTDIWGRANISEIQPITKFNSLEDAKEQIKSWKEKGTYHTIEDWRRNEIYYYI